MTISSNSWDRALRIALDNGWSAEDIQNRLHEVVETVEKLASENPGTVIEEIYNSSTQQVSVRLVGA